MKIHSLLVACAGFFCAHNGLAEVSRNPKEVYLENNLIRLGADLSIGGSITHLSLKNGPNMINSHDWGRQIQMSFYSGPQPYEPNGNKPSPKWEKLGWNPIQSGDFSGVPSKVLVQKCDGKELYIKCRPMHWPLANVPGECTFECWYTLEGNTVRVRCRLNNERDDKTQYRGRGQELPAVYSNAPWFRLMTYTGDKPYTRGALTEIPRKPEKPPFPWNSFQATEEWSALVDKDGNGFGVWVPGAQRCIGGFAGKPGEGGPKSNPTGYLAPMHIEILDHNIVYDFSYRLIVGSLDSIRDYVYKNRTEQDGLRFTFTNDRQHWHYVRATDTGYPIQGAIQVNLAESNPQLLSPLFCLDAARHKTLKLRAAFKTGEASARLRWMKLGSAKTEPEDTIKFPVSGDGSMKTYEIALDQSEQWSGTINRLILCPSTSGDAAKSVRIESLAIE